MASDAEEFDPEAPDQRAIGRDLVDDEPGLGSVVAHCYRGEMDRVVAWRDRLDSTTNWAVTIIAGILAYAFSSGDVVHSIVLVAMVVAVVFCWIEANRFRRYDIWRARIRSMQENLFATAFDPSQGVERTDWRVQLSNDYRNPEPKLTLRNALAHRLRRVYLPILCGLLVAWLLRLNGADDPLVAAAALPSVPGAVVFGTVVAGYVALFAIAFWPGRSDVSETDEDADRGDFEA